MTPKYCPHCRKQPLEITRYHGEELDLCRRCGGLWFEQDQLNEVLAARDDDVDEAAFQQTLGEKLGAADRDCPDCRRALTGYHLMPEVTVEIDHCHHCDGTWIDRHELEQVLHQPKLQTALAQLNQSISWKTWIFQILSQLPVEYNIRPRRFPFVNLALILVNVLIFATYAFGHVDPNVMVGLFGERPALFWDGYGWWTPLTAAFLHGGWIHLLGNMYFLYIIGDNLEDALGHWRYLGIYLLCAIIASMGRLVLDYDSDIPSVGASGAVAGLFGMYLLWFRNASLTFMFVVYQKKLAPVWFFGIWLLINLWGMAAQGQGGVDYVAHVCGFLAGLAFGLGLKAWVEHRNPLLRVLASPEVQVVR